MDAYSSFERNEMSDRTEGHARVRSGAPASLSGKKWLLPFIGAPVLSLVFLVATFLVEEPFPTLLMPGFSHAVDVEETTSFDRLIFVVGSDDQETPGGQEVITSVEFAQIDLTQSQALPVIRGVLRELQAGDPELEDWVHERLALLLPGSCGNTVELRSEAVAVSHGDSSFSTTNVEQSVAIGPLRCGD